MHLRWLSRDALGPTHVYRHGHESLALRAASSPLQQHPAHLADLSRQSHRSGPPHSHRSCDHPLRGGHLAVCQ
eukprot:14557806-Alexandrium_andersonii.AAC.1